MKKIFEPDYRNLMDAARNKISSRLPLYEHLVSPHKIEEITGSSFANLIEGDSHDKEEFFWHYCNFFCNNGYDIVPFEECIGSIMPGSGALGDSRIDPVIKDRSDFISYPWDELPEYYFQKYGSVFDALRKQLPPGCKLCLNGMPVPQ